MPPFLNKRDWSIDFFSFVVKHSSKMSLSFTLSGNSSILSQDVYPAVKLPRNERHYIGLVDLEVFNSFPNIDNDNNRFFVKKGGEEREIEIPVGCYEITQIEDYLKKQLGDDSISLTANMPTSQCVLESNYEVNFKKRNSIGPLLGFDSVILPAGKKHYSNLPVKITKVTSILVDCNLVTGTYLNGVPGHVLHQFAATTPPGYKIVEVPANVIYLPVNTSFIDNLTVRLSDQDGKLLNLRGETVTVRLHLKQHGFHI